jgi:Putative MetA-pathway of phenol degradation
MVQCSGKRWSIVAGVDTIIVLSIVAAVVLAIGCARAQDMEPRAYSVSPIDTNFLAASFANTEGSVSLDPSLPITGLQARVNTYTLGYDRTFDLFGQSASAAILLPEVHGYLSGQVMGQNESLSRTGVGDVRFRFAVNLIGGPATTLAEYSQRQPTTTLGTSLTVVAPTGQYDADRLINIGSNRWAIKPEIGLSQPLGNWFAEGYAGAWIFTDNSDYYYGHTRGQNPIYTLQFHGGYTFRPNLWLAADATHYIGGQTSINGAANDNWQAVTRYGVTLSVPLGSAFSAKFAWSSWLTSRNGGQYQTFGVTLQYVWFDHAGMTR